MFGTNKVMRERDYEVGPDHNTYAVQEIFATVQGEGPLTGYPAVFIRMWGCNLRCHFCDTDFESNKQTMTIEQIVDKVSELHGRARYVVITGGEPMLQELGPLVYALVLSRGLNVQIETAGTVWPSSFDDPVLVELLRQEVLTIVCSPKTGNVHAKVEEWCAHWKYIISERDKLSPVDGLPDSSTQVLGRINPVFRPPSTHCVQFTSGPKHSQVWVQPCDEYLVNRIYEPTSGKSVLDAYSHDDMTSRESVLRTSEIAMQFGYRISLQTHKLLGLP